MPNEVKVWKIADGDTLVEVSPSHLALEERLETWLERDISVLSGDLLVIGRQIATPYGGIIDLLCLDRTGDAAIVELKRDKTPREVTAQALDYASWIRTLSHEEITQIAKSYLAGRGSDLPQAFRNRFGIDLPEVLNEDHSIMVVASVIDPSSERIIEYLSDAHGVRINAATFHYFQEVDDGGLSERVVRVFLLEPETVEHRSVQRGSSKRRPAPTLEEYEELAERRGVAMLYHPFVYRLRPHFNIYSMRTIVGFYGSLDGGLRSLLSLYPAESSQAQGLHFSLYLRRLARYLGAEPEELKSVLPDSIDDWKYTSNSDQDASGFSGYFRDEQAVTRFVRFVEEKRGSIVT